MGEIKSTLDLVLERTRHLSLSAEEKEQQQREDYEKRLQGLLQQYADDAMSMDTVRKRMADLQSEMKMADQRLSAKAAVQRIDADRNNDRWLALLEHLAPDICPPLQEILTAHRKELAALLQAGRQVLGDRLAREDEIRGSAVVPNPGKDPTHRKKVMDLQHVTRTRIAALAR
jgi:hypothetical protein